MEMITSRQNAVVKRLRALSKDKDMRRDCGEFVCDGEKLFFEAVSEGCEITCILATEEFSKKLSGKECKNIYVVPQDILDSITTLKTAQNVIFSCRMKDRLPADAKKLILLDRLQDTGNIGTIIRTADAFGIDAVFCDGTADIYNPKTIRSAMGSIFRVPIAFRDFSELIPRLQSEGMTVYCSELHKDSKCVSECSFNNAAVVIGNEGNGVRPEISNLCDKSVIIPMSGGAESLNAAVAAAIFMYEMSEK